MLKYLGFFEKNFFLISNLKTLKFWTFFWKKIFFNFKFKNIKH